MLLLLLLLLGGAGDLGPAPSRSSGGEGVHGVECGINVEERRPSGVVRVVSDAGGSGPRPPTAAEVLRLGLLVGGVEGVASSTCPSPSTTPTQRGRESLL